MFFIGKRDYAQFYCATAPLNIVIEYIWRQDVIETIGWVTKPSYREALYIVLIAELILYLLINNVGITTIIINFMGALIASINYLKISMKGETFTLSDISLFKEALGVVSEYKVNFNSVFWIAMLILIATSICMMLVNVKISTNKPIRLCMILGSITLALLFKPCCITINSKLGYTGTVFETVSRYKSEGLIPGLIVTLPKEVEKPHKYSKKQVQEVCNSIPIAAADKNTKPNVIFIMNESLFDITSFDSIILNEDPLQKMKNYQKNYIGGNLLTPSYAGSTAQVEYEVLTGYPGYNLSGVAYTDYIKKEMDTLVSLYKARGYETYAFHPNNKEFYNRNKVYNLFGFDHVYFKDDLEIDIEATQCGWVTDKSLYENIVYELEKRKDSRPAFVFVVTMQNHGGHIWEYDKEKKIQLVSGATEDNKMALETYVNLCYESDIALDNLLSKLNIWTTPTIVTMFGDHAPDLSQFGLDIENKYLETHRTPLLIWNNYSLPSKDIGDICAYKLGAYVANLSGINSDCFINMLNSKDSSNIVDNRLITTSNEIILRDSWDESTLKVEENRWLLQYDRMFGKQYYNEVTNNAN